VHADKVTAPSGGPPIGLFVVLHPETATEKELKAEIAKVT
jgi:hypothetical protein